MILIQVIVVCVCYTLLFVCVIHSLEEGDYTKCELHNFQTIKTSLPTCLLLLSNTHINICHILLLVFTVSMLGQL